MFSIFTYHLDFGTSVAMTANVEFSITNYKTLIINILYDKKSNISEEIRRILK